MGSVVQTFSKYLTVLVVLIVCSIDAFAQIVFDDVNIIDIENGSLDAHQRVVTRDDRIIAVGAKDLIAVPEGATIVDASGKFLSPGLGERHGHIPQFDIGTEAVKDILFLYRSNGVTTVRGML